MKEVHIGSIQKRLVGNKCPHCGKPADGGTSIDDKRAARIPKPGDLAICAYCEALNRYTETLALRGIERTERRQMMRDPRLKELLEMASRVAQQKRREWQ